MESSIDYKQFLGETAVVATVSALFVVSSNAWNIENYVRLTSQYTFAVLVAMLLFKTIQKVV